VSVGTRGDCIEKGIPLSEGGARYNIGLIGMVGTRDLTVKVSGYNAPFVELYRELHDSIIARTEHRL